MTLVHSNALMIEVIASYCVAIQYLIMNNDDPDRGQLAFREAEKFAKT